MIQGPPGVEFVQGIASLHPIPLLEHRGRDPYLLLSSDPDAFAKALETWLNGNLPARSGATAWAGYGVSVGRLVVSSWPAGATVLVDGAPVGATERVGEQGLGQKALWLPVGHRVVTLRKEGFLARSRVIRVGLCKTETVTFWLEPPGRLSVGSCPAGAGVLVDGREAGRTPVALELEPGKHTIVVYLFGYKRWSREVRLGPGERMDLYAALRPNAWPTARFQVAPTTVVAGEEVLCDASASRDPDGEIVRYEWNLDGDGRPDAEGVRTYRRFRTFGRHAVALAVTDDDGARETTRLALRVCARPVATLAFSPTTPFVGDPIRFDASGYGDPDGRILDYGWDFADGRAAAGKVVEHTYATPGTYHVAPLVRDEDGGYIADIPDLGACSAFGSTAEEALREVEIAKAAWMEVARAEGRPIPEPRYRPAIYHATG